MSQKATRRARRQTNDEDTPTFKAPTPKPNGAEESLALPEEAEQPEQPQPKEPTPPPPPLEEPAEKEPPPPSREEETPERESDGVVTRSRSTTPQVKKMINGHDEEDLDSATKEEMEPLVVTDEPDPELNFEESSDLESGRESPVLSRCTTRRSATRSIPTPKSPRVEEEPQVDEEDASDSPGREEPEEELNATFESCADDVSTKAQVGGDSTRLNYTESNFESNSFLKEAKSKTFGETLRRLSTRRTIRPINDDFRRRFLQTTVEKDNSRPYPTRNSVESVASVGGAKRKREDSEDEFTKRYKSDSPGFFAKFTSPLNSFKNPFRGDVASSTPKLTGYKDDKCQIEEDGINSQMCEIQTEERRWCSIM